MNLGLLSLDNANTTVANPNFIAAATNQPNYEQIVNDAYARLGRTGIGTDPNQIDQEGYNYWLNQLQTQAIKPQDFQSAFNTGAETTYINQAYQDLFGRAPEAAGLQNWQNTLNTTNKNDIYKAIAAGAQGADKTAFEQYQQREIEKAYQDLFGRAPEESGLQNWLATDLIGTDLINALREGAMGADIGALYNKADTDIATGARAMDVRDFVNQNQNDPYAIYSAAEKFRIDPETVTAIMGYTPEQSAGFLDKYNLARKVAQEYQDIGRGVEGDSAIDQEGFNYWYNQLQSGAITPEQFEQAFLTGARDVTSKGYEDQYVNANVIAESLAKGYGGVELLDRTNALDVYEVLGKKGISPEDIIAKNPTVTMDQVNNYFANVPSLYGDYINSTFNSVLGDGVSDRISDEYRQNAVNNLLTGEITRDEFLEQLQNSGANKNQEAQRIASSYISMYGGNQDDANALYAKLLGIEYTGPGVVKDDVYKIAKNIFDTSLKDESAGLTTLIKTAANLEGAENNEFFKNNPDALYIYGDLKTRSDNPYTQYGTVNGAPVYDANAVDKYLEMVSGGLNSASSFAHRSSDRLGVEVGGNLDGGSAFIKRGADVLGLELVPEMRGDGDGGYTPTGRYTVSGDINAAAQQAGIDPSKFQDKYRTETSTDEYGNKSEYQVLEKSASEQIYDAINDKFGSLYLIGSQNPANPNEKSPDNFMYTLYQRTEDGKLIPVNEPTYYEGVVNPDVFKKKGMFGGGWLGDIAQNLASVPGLPEIIGAMTGNPALYAALKGAQTAAFSNSLKDVGKSAGLAYLSAQYLPEVTKGVSNYIDLGNPILNQAITQGTVGAGMSMLTGGSGTEGFTSGAISGGVGGGLDMANSELRSFAINDLNVDPKFASVFTNTLTSLAPTLLTGGKIDPTKVLMNYMMKQAISGARDTYSASGRGTPNNYINTGVMDNRDVVAP